MPLRRPAGWMQAADDRLLEYLDEEGASGVKRIHDLAGLNYHYETIRRRLRLLWYAGFVNRIGEGTYAITDQGEDYLQGEKDFSDLEKPDPDTDPEPSY